MDEKHFNLRLGDSFEIARARIEHELMRRPEQAQAELFEALS